MTKLEFANAWNAARGHTGQYAAAVRYAFDASRPVEHVTIVGDGEDFHSSDSARALLEVGYWGTLDADAVTP